MKILSWDVGIINLSYCILEYNEDTKENKILFWGIINLIDDPIMKKNMNLVFENIPKKLDENKFLLDVDAVVIENQPSLKNPKMKSIQMIVYSYFLMYGKVLNDSENKIENIDFCNASNKLKVYKGPEISLDDLKKKKKKVDNNSLITDFTEEKKDDLEIVEPEAKTKKSTKLSYADKKKMAVAHVKYFLKENMDENNLEFFNEHKKKDDLADSYLQGLYVINIKLKKK